MNRVPDAPTAWDWSSTRSNNHSNKAYAVSFYSGTEVTWDTWDISDRNKLKVRLVRGSRWVNSPGIVEADRQALDSVKNARKAEEQARKELEQRKAEEQRRILADLFQAEKSAFFACPNKSVCDKALSLTQIYINQNADMKMQVVTDTIIETYNPTEDGKLGLKAIRIPGKGTSARIVLSATCKD